MHHRQQAKTSGGRSGIVVILRGQPRNRLGEIVRERGARRGARETDFGFYGERGEAAGDFFCTHQPRA